MTHALPALNAMISPALHICRMETGWHFKMLAASWML